MCGCRRASILVVAVTAAGTGPGLSGQERSGTDSGSVRPQGGVHVSAGGGTELAGNGGDLGRLAVTWVTPGGRYLFGVRFDGSSDDGGTESSLASAGDIALLVGVRGSNRRGWVSLSSGVSRVEGTRRGAYRQKEPFECEGGEGFGPLGCAIAGVIHDAGPDEWYEAEPFTTLGIPIEGEVGLKLGSRWGLAVGAFAKLNREWSAFGTTTTVSVRLGG